MADTRLANADNTSSPLDSQKPVDKTGKKAVKDTKYVDLNPVLPGSFMREAFQTLFKRLNKVNEADVEDYEKGSDKTRLGAYKKARDAALKKRKMDVGGGQDELEKTWKDYKDVAGPWHHKESFSRFRARRANEIINNSEFQGESQ